MRARSGRAAGSSWLAVTTGVGLAAALLWALTHLGGTEAHTPYVLFLMLALPTTALCALVRPAAPGGVRFFVLAAIGAFVVSQLIVRGAVEGAGYVHLCLGWMALVLALGMARIDARSRAPFLLFLVALGVAEAVYGLFQSLGGYDYIGTQFRDSGNLATGGFVNRNHFSGFVNMTIGLGVGFLGAGGQGVFRWLGRPVGRSLVSVLCVVMGLAVLLSQSRGGAVSLAASLAFAWLLVAMSARRRGGSRASGRAVALVALGVMVLALIVGTTELWSRFERLPETNRPAVYRDTVRLISDQPWLGVGPGMYRWRFRPYQGPDVGKLYEHAHNDYLQAAAEWGVPLAVLFWLFVVRRWQRCASLVLRSEQPAARGLALGCATAIFSILVHSLVDFNLQIPSNLLSFMAIVGVAWSLEQWSSDRSLA